MHPLSKHPLLSQIQSLVERHFPNFSSNTARAMSDDTRLAILHALLPICPQIPHPASGNTLLRWQILAYVAGKDLTLVKWLESHLDALSILQELGYDTIFRQHPNKLWAVWAAEGHPTPVKFTAENGFLENMTTLEKNATVQGVCMGVKTWCSGANVVDFGLMTYRDAQHQSQLLIIDMKQHANSIGIDNSSWQAVGMHATDTATLTFHHTPTILLANGDTACDTKSTGKNYLNRAGFWHGGVGVAACWYGASVAIATYLQTSYQQKPNPYKAMYLGQVSTQLAVTQQYFYHLAQLIDESQKRDTNGTNQGNINAHYQLLAIRQLRQQVETTARFVLDQTGQALGATPFCQNAHFARLAADLAVFIRQSHGAFDAQAIGELASDLTQTLTKQSVEQSAEHLAETGQASVWQL